MQPKALEVLFFANDTKHLNQLQSLVDSGRFNVRIENHAAMLPDLLQDENFDVLIYMAGKMDVQVSRRLREYQAAVPALFIVLISDLTALPESLTAHYLFPLNALNDPNQVRVHSGNIDRLATLHKQQAELSGMLLHDLRSPAQSIIGYFELLEQEVFGAVNEGQRQIMLSAMALGDSIIDLMEELGQVYRFEKSQFELVKAKLDIKTIIDEALRFIWVQADRKNIMFSRKFGENLPVIEADSMALHRVFTNLLQNAIRFSPENSSLQISVNGNAQHDLEIAISDKGPGLPDDQIGDVFDKYFRIIDYKNKQKGQGLGLYICRLIVEAHGGTISAANNPEKGMTFRFTLPAIKNS